MVKIETVSSWVCSLVTYQFN